MKFKAKFTTYAMNGGDGSVIVKFFASPKMAEDFAKKDVEESGIDERYCEDIQTHELSFDEDGNFLND